MAGLAIFRDGELPPLTRAVNAPEQRGIEPSAYVGRLFKDGEYERMRRCILAREANGHYGAASATGKYRGGYQVSPELGVGMGWMIQAALIEEGVPRAEAIEIGRTLRDTPVNQWAREWQDLGFYVTLHAEGEASGVKHWQAAGTYSCGW